MLASRSTVPLFSVRTFFKHLPISPFRATLKTLATTTTTTTKILGSSSFQTLSPLQKDQVHRYVDALLQGNQVALSLFLCFSVCVCFWMPRNWGGKGTSFADDEPDGGDGGERGDGEARRGLAGDRGADSELVSRRFVRWSQRCWRWKWCWPSWIDLGHCLPW